MPVKNFNTTIAKTFHDRMNVRDGVFLDNELSQNKVVPVIDIDKPIINVVKTASTSNGNLSIYTTPADKDFYLCSIQYHRVKDATSDCANTSVTATINGTSTAILVAQGIGTTAQDDSIVINLSVPLKIDRSTAIAATDNAHSVGLSNHTCTLYGFLSDTLRY